MRNIDFAREYDIAKNTHFRRSIPFIYDGFGHFPPFPNGVPFFNFGRFGAKPAAFNEKPFYAASLRPDRGDYIGSLRMRNISRAGIYDGAGNWGGPLLSIKVPSLLGIIRPSAE